MVQARINANLFCDKIEGVPAIKCPQRNDNCNTKLPDRIRFKKKTCESSKAKRKIACHMLKTHNKEQALKKK
jgi:hypothetical protein